MLALVLRGDVLTVDRERREVRRGAVYLQGGRIEAVQPASAAAPAGYRRARRVTVGGTIAPGLIDLHNHLAYNTLPLWVGRGRAYETRYQWPGAPTYQSAVSNPAQALGLAAAGAALRYAEVKAVVGGVTSIQGSPRVTRAFPGWMLRNVEKEDLGHGQSIYQSVLPATDDQLSKMADKMRSGRSFIYHLGEGSSAALRSEFDQLAAHGCVGEGLIAIHSTALTSADFASWAGRGAGAMVWSPFSNLWLYGTTGDILAARRSGVRVCLGSDWTPSGTRNVLHELKIAAWWNRTALGGELTPADLVELVTANPGDTLARPWGVQVGRLEPGALADIAVFSSAAGTGPDALLNGTEHHVRLVLVGGRAAYGTPALVRACGVTDAEAVRVLGRSRALVMRLADELQPDAPDLRAQANMSWATGLAELGRVWRDPAEAVRSVRRAVQRGAEPLRFVPDLPAAGGGASRALSDEELDQLVMPTLDGIGHDAGWRADVRDRAPAHAAHLAAAVTATGTRG